MIHAQATKVFQVIAPAAIVDNASPTSKVIDCAGYSHAQVYVMLGATDIALTALKLQESNVAADANSLTGGADVPGCVFGTSNQISGAASTLPSATDDNKIYCFDVDLRGRKRYLDLLATVGDGAAGGFIVAWAVLSRPGEMPYTAAARGCGQILRAAG